MDATIADYAVDCLEGFKAISTVTPVESQRCAGKASQKIKDEYPRFKVWCGNIGAHHKGRRYLDHRLRDASHLASQVKSLLVDMKDSLATAYSILNGTKVPWDREVLDEDEDEDDDLGGPEGDDIGFATELDQISADIVEIINCLLNLSVSIRNPAPHDRFQDSVQTDTSFYEPADIAHVKAKFDKADDRLLRQLGTANSRRRQYFKYRESHHQKLSQGMDFDAGIADKSTVASSIPLAMKINPVAHPNTVNEDELSDSGFTQTSYTPSVENSDMRRLPPLPAKAARGPFECPFCFMMIRVSTSYAWRKHIFADLRPYSCVAVNCPMSGAEFGRRHRWMQHMLQSHWRDWYCTFCDHDPFSSTMDLQEHLKVTHASIVSNDDLQSVASLCERPRPFSEDTTCPLCLCPLESARQYRHHVGGHLEDIAVFVLPPVFEDEDIPDEEDIINSLNSHPSTRLSENVGQELEYDAELEDVLDRKSAVGYVQKNEELIDPGTNHDGERELKIKSDGGEAKLWDSNEDSDDLSATEAGFRGGQGKKGLHGNPGQPRSGNDSETKEAMKMSSSLILPIELFTKMNKTSMTTSRGMVEGFSRESENFEKRRTSGLEERPQSHYAAERLMSFRDLRDANADHPRRIYKLEQHFNKMAEEFERSRREELVTLEPSRRSQVANAESSENKVVDSIDDQRLKWNLQGEDELQNTKQELADFDAQSNERFDAQLREKKYKNILIQQLLQSGFTNEDITRILDDQRLDDADVEEKKEKDKDLRPTWTRMARRHVSLETLRVYDVEYQLDDDPQFVLIKRWVPESEQDTLWRHTRMIREQRVSKQAAVTKEKGDNQQYHIDLEQGINEIPRKGRRRSRSPSLLMYLAGGRPT
ncbi:hypothetical protein BX600DRAFT_532763 [Xylariales sp. PMI_506]|nr:hypothetical protein BX600DRAFT_532763 [Xylariales sp. PMI_506]